MAIARESGERERVVVVVVGLPIVMPTTKQWGKVEVGLGFGNIKYFLLILEAYHCLAK